MPDTEVRPRPFTPETFVYANRSDRRNDSKSEAKTEAPPESARKATAAVAGKPAPADANGRNGDGPRSSRSRADFFVPDLNFLVFSNP